MRKAYLLMLKIPIWNGFEKHVNFVSKAPITADRVFGDQQYFVNAKVATAFLRGIENKYAHQPVIIPFHFAVHAVVVSKMPDVFIQIH